MHSATPTGECRSWNAHASLLCTLFLIALLSGGCGQEAVYLAAESGSAADASESTIASESAGSIEAAGGTESGSSAEDAEAEISAVDADSLDSSAGSEAEVLSGSEADSGSIYVYVCGAVVSPGLYQLEQGSRVYDAITAAGGLRDDASEDYWNQAAYVSDGQMIDVPTEAEVEAGLADASSGSNAADSGTDTSYGVDASGNSTDGSSGADSSGSDTDASSSSSDTDADTGTSSGRININTATAEELMQIPGIGEARAAAIISYREQSGGFSVVEDIKNVSGIGDALFEKMKNYIEV